MRSRYLPVICGLAALLAVALSWTYLLVFHRDGRTEEAVAKPTQEQESGSTHSGAQGRPETSGSKRSFGAGGDDALRVKSEDIPSAIRELARALERNEDETAIAMSRAMLGNPDAPPAAMAMLFDETGTPRSDPLTSGAMTTAICIAGGDSVRRRVFEHVAAGWKEYELTPANAAAWKEVDSKRAEVLALTALSAVDMALMNGASHSLTFVRRFISESWAEYERVWDSVATLKGRMDPAISFLLDHHARTLAFVPATKDCFTAHAIAVRDDTTRSLRLRIQAAAYVADAGASLTETLSALRAALGVKDAATVMRDLVRKDLPIARADWKLILAALLERFSKVDATAVFREVFMFGDEKLFSLTHIPEYGSDLLMIAATTDDEGGSFELAGWAFLQLVIGRTSLTMRKHTSGTPWQLPITNRHNADAEWQALVDSLRAARIDSLNENARQSYLSNVVRMFFALEVTLDRKIDGMRKVLAACNSHTERVAVCVQASASLNDVMAYSLNVDGRSIYDGAVDVLAAYMKCPLIDRNPALVFMDCRVIAQALVGALRVLNFPPMRPEIVDLLRGLHERFTVAEIAWFEKPENQGGKAALPYDGREYGKIKTELKKAYGFEWLEKP